MVEAVFPSNHEAFLGKADICLPMETVVEFLVWFAYEAVFISTHDFSLFNSSDSLHHPYTRGVREWLCGV